MKFINQLNQPMQHCEDAVAHLLHSLKIKFTKSHLQKELTEHPDYPTLAAIADVIGMSYDVCCAPIKQAIGDYKNSLDFRLPFLAQIKPQNLHHDVFAVVTQFSDDSIEFYNPATQKKELLTIACFAEIYKGVLLIVEAGKKTEESNYEEHLKKEKQRNFFNVIAALALPVLTIIFSTIHLLNSPLSQAIVAVVYTLSILAGCIITTLLLWNEIDEYNPVMKQMCQATAKVNCSAVLNSKASKIMGISWSSLGFTYFAGTLLFLLATGLSLNTLIVASWVNVLALPYTLFSLYYQWKIVKQWCRLCLIVQGLLLLLSINGLVGGFYNLELLSAVSIQSWLGTTVAFAFVFSIVVVLVPALKMAKKYRQKNIELQRIKHNTQIFDSLLTKQKLLTELPDGLGITIGNPDSVLKLIKVCNPYCGPCAEAHPIIEELVENNDELSVQIIFTATEDKKDIKRAPAMHLMSIAEKNSEATIKQALNAWYNTPKKDYKIFAEKYAAYLPSEEMNQPIRAMHKWCDTVKISATPTFFVCMNRLHRENGTPKFYQLPDMYNITDLKYIFTV